MSFDGTHSRTRLIKCLVWAACGGWDSKLNKKDDVGSHLVGQIKNPLRHVVTNDMRGEVQGLGKHVAGVMTLPYGSKNKSVYFLL